MSARSRWRPRGWAATAAAVALAAPLVAASCTGSRPSGLPGEPFVVRVTMQDAGGYRFVYQPVIPGGRVVWKVVNAGRLVHRLTLLPLSDDLPPIDEQLHGEERQALTPFAGVPDRLPGETGTFATDLLPGHRYALICFNQDPDGVSHALKGMNSEFRTTGGQPAPSP